MSVPREFASDNTAPVHPAVLDALVAANSGPASAYGADPWTARATAWFRAQFGAETAVFLAWNGTGANVVSLRALVRPYQAVICTSQAHTSRRGASIVTARVVCRSSASTSSSPGSTALTSSARAPQVYIHGATWLRYSAVTPTAAITFASARRDFPIA